VYVLCCSTASSINMPWPRCFQHTLSETWNTVRNICQYDSGFVHRVIQATALGAVVVWKRESNSTRCWRSRNTYKQQKLGVRLWPIRSNWVRL
jgi:hypothetical protein